MIPYVSDLVKKIEYNAKLSDIKDKYSTTSDYNEFVNEILDIKVKGKGLVDHSDISRLIDNSDLDKKKKNSNITNKSRVKSKAIKNGETAIV